MIQFGNRKPFDFCVSSGALGFDGKGWWWERPLVWSRLIDTSQFVVVAKTITVEPRAGNLRMWSPWTCVRTLKGLATVNAVGLTNPGLVNEFDFDPDLVPSIKPESIEDARKLAFFYQTRESPYIEVNLSCPNVADHVPTDIPEMLKILGECDKPIVLKLSLDQVNPRFIEAVDQHIDAYHAINAVPWDNIFPGQKSPIEGYAHKLKGGVSGPPIHRLAVEAVGRLKKMTHSPIIGGGGIFSVEDVVRFHDAGADAFSIGTCFLHRPLRPNRIVRLYRKHQNSL